MANANKEFDEFFKKKLIDHEVKPSQLAWERLENKLPAPEKKAGFPILRIAASIIMLLGLGYLIWYGSQLDTAGLPELAEVEQEFEQPQVKKPKTEIQEVPFLAEETEEKTTEDHSEVKEEPKHGGTEVNKKNITAPQPTYDSPSKQIAEALPPIEIEQETVTDIYEIELPELKLQEVLAEAKAPEIELVEEQGYSIRIISNGFAEEPKKEGLIEELETKIEKIGGLLNKVDQGFADLQDAKNNLFANITTRKVKSK